MRWRGFFDQSRERFAWNGEYKGDTDSVRFRIGVIAFFASIAIFACVSWRSFMTSNPSHGERKEHSTGKDFLGLTEIDPSPHLSVSALGWDSERVWSGHDDWEPFVAADRASPYVYQTTTRFNARVSGIFVRASADAGATWLADHLVAPIDQWQADPQIQVADDGTAFLAWLDGPDWKSKLIKSTDHGATWTPPIEVAPSLRWTDHPWLLVSPSGSDVYVGLNEDDSYIVTSHDGGQTFSVPYRTNDPTPGHWWDANGAAIAPDGTPYFVVIDFFLNYRGPANVYVISSHDNGMTWQQTLVDTSQPPPGCNGSAGCEYGFLSTTAGIAIGADGRLLLAYHANDEPKAPQAMWIRTSNDGLNWTPRFRVSQPDEDATNGFPSVAAGPVAGDFRLVWQGNRNGDPRGWNTFYRRTTDGGVTWSPITTLSNRKRGAPYKNHEGYAFPYGDYLSLSVDGNGMNHVIWGEGASYEGPGGVWYTRGF